MQIFKREQHRNNMNSKKTLGFSNGLDYNEYLHSMNKYNLNNSTQQNVCQREQSSIVLQHWTLFKS